MSSRACPPPATAGGRGPRFVVAAAPRSGTGYAATVLSLLGRSCGHEAVFRPGAPERPGDAWPPGLQGDSSWLAVPFLEALPPGTVVLHQVRDPQAVVRSLLRIRFFERTSPFRAFAARHCPETRSGAPAERALGFWVAWNRLAERAAAAAHLHYARYRLEDLDAPRLQALLAALGAVPEEATVRSVWDGVPRDVNSRGDPTRDAALATALGASSPVVTEANDLAARYGYTDPPPGSSA